MGDKTQQIEKECFEGKRQIKRAERRNDEYEAQENKKNEECYEEDEAESEEDSENKNK